MGKTLFNQFAGYVLKHPDTDIIECYNQYLRETKLSSGEIGFISDNYVLFIKTGEAARKTLPSIQKILMQ